MHRIPRYIAGTVFVAILALGLLFVILTRTEVGRDALRVQIERSFDAQFHGTLSIEHLSGNLLNDLFARNVVIRDPDGYAVLRIDSVALRPRWMDFFRETISIRSATLINPEADLVRDADGRWNVERAFHSRRVRTGGHPWHLSGANLTIRNGTLTTQNHGRSPVVIQNGLVFDFANARFEQIDARATVDWRSDFHLVDLLQLSTALPGLDLDVSSVRGQFVNAEEGTSLNRFTARIGESNLNLDFGLDGFDLMAEATDAGRLQNAGLRLSVTDSYVDAADLVKLFPSLPIAGRLHLDARLDGSLADLTVSRLHMRKEESDLSITGTVRGLPDHANIRYEMAPSTFRVREVAELLPFADLSAFRPEEIISLTSSGDVSLNGGTSQLSVRSIFSASGRFGEAEGSVEARSVRGSPLAYALDLTARNVDAGAFLAEPPAQMSVTGRLSLKGRGLTQQDLQAQIDGQFRSTSIAGRSADTLQISGMLEGYRFQGASLIAGAGGALWTSGYVDLNGTPSVNLQARAEDFDASLLLPDAAFSTRLNGLLTLSGEGWGPDDFEGTADLLADHSSITDETGERLIPPFHTGVSVSTRDAQHAIVRLNGDLVEGSVEGRFTLPLLAETVRLWGHGVRRSVFLTLDKPLNQPVALASASGSSSEEEEPAFSLLSDREDFDRLHLLRFDVAAGLEAARLRNVHLDARLEVKRSSVLAAVVPALQDVQVNGLNTLRLDATEGRLTLTAGSSADSVRIGGLRIVKPRLAFTAAAILEPGREAVVSLNLGAQARNATGSGRDLGDLTAELHFQDEIGRFETSIGRIGESGSLDLSARINHLRDRNRVTIESFSLGVRDRIWRAVNEPRIDVYRDAMVFHRITLENLPPDANGEPGHQQQIAIDGAVSSSRRDTVFVTAENIDLDEISELLALRDPVGGTLNGQVAMTSIDPYVEITGALEIDGVTFLDRPLGRAHIESRFSPHDNLIELDLTLRQTDTLAVWMQNDLAISGNVHLGGTGPLNEAGRADLFDLSVEVNSMDLFFFERIFPDLVDDVEARVVGSGRVRGDFKYPLFYADLQIPAGRFRVPEFNLGYEVSGPFRVDREGFHFSEVRVSDDTGGRTHVSGGILFNDYRYFSFDLSGRLDDMLIMNVPSSRELPFYGRIWLSGNATLRGPISSSFLRSNDLVANRRSELFIPVTGGTLDRDEGFIVFADSTGQIPDLSLITRRAGILAERPPGERGFLDGLEMSLNITAPRGSTVHLVFDPMLGDVINAVGSGRIQLQLIEGEFATFGSFNIDSGDYLFTAGEVFTRRFLLESGGTITWDGDPINARLQIPAVYRTRASLVGLPGYESQQRIPLLVRLDVSGRVQAPAVDLRLQIARDDRTAFGVVEGLESLLNQPDRAAEYATSVLLTNTFLLTTTTGTETLPGAADDLFFNSVSQLVANQLNRFVNQALTNVEVTLGVQSARTQDLDLTYGIALRLLDERLIIRGTGVYESAPSRGRAETLQGEFIVEVRLSPRVSVEVFYRREEDLANFTSNMYGAYGAGVNYQADFVNWRQFFSQIGSWVKDWLP